MEPFLAGIDPTKSVIDPSYTVIDPRIIASHKINGLVVKVGIFIDFRLRSLRSLCIIGIKKSVAT